MNISQHLTPTQRPAAAPPIVSGRYRGSRGGVEVELRVDIDGVRATQRVSADYFTRSGDHSEYVESMRLDAPKITVVRQVITIRGTALFSRGSRRRVEVTIPRQLSDRAPATFRHVAAGGARELPWVCEFEDRSFREVDLEEAVERGVERPPAFDTQSLPSALVPPRMLATTDVYAMAGIRLVSSGQPTVVASAEAGPDAAWSDAELHAAMEQHFSRFGEDPRWAIWLLHATDHVNRRLSGIMFDQFGPQRQGCAVFYGREPATSPRQRRDRLYNCVHEVGHGFNLRHCWERSLTTPPIDSRPDSRTWMNYPDRDRRGSEAFFEAFGFEFDDAELVHLRHAFRDQVIQGGQAFTAGAGRERSSDWNAEPQDPALRLTLAVPATVGLHSPVIARLELTSAARDDRSAPTTLDPRSQTAAISIRRPDGEEAFFEPLLRHCRGGESLTLRPGAATVRDFSFLHYGTKGFVFDQPGVYRLRARHAAPDGRIAVSNVATLRVLAPVTRDERAVADLVAGDEQVGTLLSLAGSRAPELNRGNAKLSEIIRRHPSHPLAAVARVTQATSLARAFKTIASNGAVLTAPAQPEEAFRLIRPVIDLGAALRAAATVEGEVAQQQVFASALARIGSKPGMSPLVSAFTDSRLAELATARRGLAPPRAPAAPVRTRRIITDSGSTSEPTTAA